jgi:transposase
MHWSQNYVFIGEAGFNMHIRRKFGWIKKDMPVKSVIPSNRGVTVTITGVICEKVVVELTLRKPKAVQKKNCTTKKRKRDNGKAGEVEVSARVGTRSEHFLDFLSSLMDALDQFKMQGCYLVMDNAAIHKVDEVQELITSRGYKIAYLPPYSSFLNLIESFWSKIKGNIRRDCLSANDNLSARITESAKKVTQQDSVNWISLSQSFFDRCLALEPML